MRRNTPRPNSHCTPSAAEKNELDDIREVKKEATIPFEKGSYTGEILNCVPHGIGTYTDSKGNKEYGMWSYGMRHGYIKKTDKKGQTKTLAYSLNKEQKGAFVRGTLVGFDVEGAKGTVFYGDGQLPDRSADGFFKDGFIVTGKQYERQSGTSCDGIYASNSLVKGSATILNNKISINFTGKGYLGTFDGDNTSMRISHGREVITYEGTVCYNEATGYGVRKDNESVKKGYMFDTRLCGEGEYTVPSKHMRVVGTFDDDQLRKGQIYYKDSLVYDGELEADEKVNYTQEGNTVTVGVYNERTKMFKGNIYKNNRLRLKGQLDDNGNMTGFCTQYDTLGRVKAQGNFKDNVLDGEGVYYIDEIGSSINIVARGTWEKGALTGKATLEYDGSLTGKHYKTTVTFKDGISGNDDVTICDGKRVNSNWRWKIIM